jgi:hypothetical protein
MFFVAIVVVQSMCYTLFLILCHAENADDCPFTESSSSSDNEEMPVGNLYPYRFEPVVGQEDSSSDDDNDIDRNQPDEQQLQQRLHDLSW